MTDLSQETSSSSEARACAFSIPQAKKYGRLLAYIRRTRSIQKKKVRIVLEAHLIRVRHSRTVSFLTSPFTTQESGAITTTYMRIRPVRLPSPKLRSYFERSSNPLYSWSSWSGRRFFHLVKSKRLATRRIDTEPCSDAYILSTPFCGASS